MDEFLAFKKETHCLDKFMRKSVGARSQLSNLMKVFEILLILSHGHAQVEHGFSTNNMLLDDNMLGDPLIAQRIGHDHMISQSIQPHQINMTG